MSSSYLEISALTAASRRESHWHGGDAVVLMAADLQDPPEVIPRFVRLWEEGYENVYGIVGERRGTSPLRRLNSRLFYWLIGRLADHPIPPNARDFRLLDRKLYEQIQQMNEHSRFIRGLAAWPGFRSVGVEFDQPERFAGESKANSGGVSELAVRAIFANSLAPLKLLPFVGALMVVGSALALVSLVIYWVIAGVPFPGFGAIIATMLLVFRATCHALEHPRHIRRPYLRRGPRSPQLRDTSDRQRGILAGRFRRLLGEPDDAALECGN